jgi:hypothetical protein
MDKAVRHPPDEVFFNPVACKIKLSADSAHSLFPQPFPARHHLDPIGSGRRLNFSKVRLFVPFPPVILQQHFNLHAFLPYLTIFLFFIAGYQG